ncbi:MAG: acylphosphatase [Patescibacteria group bacterium]|nr:acylphosphatase [bacterium]MDZ4240997.1 acylphosphatase [Patescibacteria group bacterium]
MHRIECVVTGKVQGVFFRDFAKENADELGIVGDIKNQEDGSVFLVAEGGKSALENFITKLSKGPQSAQVTNVSVAWREAVGGYNFFSIS